MTDEDMKKLEDNVTYVKDTAPEEASLSQTGMLYYMQKKRSKVLAYVLGALFGGFGVHAFYVGGEAGNVLGFLTLLCGFLTFSYPASMGSIYMIFVLSGVVYTHFIVDARNKQLMKEAKLFK